MKYQYKLQGKTVDKQTLMEYLAEQYEQDDDGYAEYLKECKELGVEPDEQWEWAGEMAAYDVKIEEKAQANSLMDEWRISDEQD